MNDESIKGGRPPIYTNQGSPLCVQSVRLTVWHVRAARRLGNGNVSAGLRVALDIAASAEDSIQKPVKTK